MPRRASPGVRPIENDPLYGSKLVQQVINKVMIDGKKSTAEQIVYDALDILSKRTNTEPVPAFICQWPTRPGTVRTSKPFVASICAAERA